MVNDTHDYCWKMLPWFVTGRLSVSDLQRIEQHVAECETCRVELEEQRELCMHIRRDEPVMLAPQASLQKMMARIDADGAQHDVELDVSTPGRGAIRVVRPRSYRWLAIAAAVQTVAIAVLLTFVGRQPSAEMTAPRFTTLSTPAAASSEGALLRVVFQPASSTSQVQTLLQSVDAQIVAGPTEAGVYTLSLPFEKTALAAQALSQVRADAIVVFAEQVAAERKP